MEDGKAAGESQRAPTRPAPASTMHPVAPPGAAPAVANPQAAPPAPANPQAAANPQPAANPQAAAPAPANPPAAAPAAAAPATSNLPMYYELPYEARKQVLPLTLSMHVYAANPAQRFVVIDGARKSEGEAVKDDVTLREIRPDGVVLEYRGQRFFYPRPGH
jgi:general secretion pathway protein B